LPAKWSTFAPGERTIVSSRIERIRGRAIVLRGDDIDTDRIMPARFLKAVTFEGLEAHLFEDDRRALASQGATHAFDDPARQGARVLLAGVNFGCGSSREHAPQALARWGIQAIIAPSFAEIFNSNSLMIGLACVIAEADDLERLRLIAETAPAQEFVVDLAAKVANAGSLTVPIQQSDATRTALLTGSWDTTGLLLEAYAAVEQKAATLPYIQGF
jgi:3-isopropylmalate/(R)-2-methylmalate dehydratase small subunit